VPYPLNYPVFAVLTDPTTPLLLEAPDDVRLPLWADRDAAESYLARSGRRGGGLLRVAGPRALAALLASDLACEATGVVVDPPDDRSPGRPTLTLPELFAPLRRAA
jgi:hypothetical protein